MKKMSWIFLACFFSIPVFADEGNWQTSFDEAFKEAENGVPGVPQFFDYAGGVGAIAVGGSVTITTTGTRVISKRLQKFFTKNGPANLVGPTKAVALVSRVGQVVGLIVMAGGVYRLVTLASGEAPELLPMGGDVNVDGQSAMDFLERISPNAQ